VCCVLCHRYCSVACQKQQWRDHKALCRPVQGLMDSSRAAGSQKEPQPEPGKGPKPAAGRKGLTGFARGWLQKGLVVSSRK